MGSIIKPDIFTNHIDEKWRLILTENIILSRLLDKDERIDMLYGYAETLADTLCNKLNLQELSNITYITGLNDLERAYITLDKYIKANPLSDESFTKGIEELEILYIEKNIDTLEPLALCKNLKYIVLDGYWIKEYSFTNFSPLRDLGEIYIWHNSGDSKILHKLNAYTNIDEFPNVKYSENSDDPWADFCDKIKLLTESK